jgi:catechol 2,3-dioxygenase-like lactoylglutathione lyase family enzyme
MVDRRSRGGANGRAVSSRHRGPHTLLVALEHAQLRSEEEVDGEAQVDGEEVDSEAEVDGEEVDGQAQVDGEEVDRQALDRQEVDGQAQVDGQAEVDREAQVDRQALDRQAVDREEVDGQAQDGVALAQRVAALVPVGLNSSTRAPAEPGPVWTERMPRVRRYPRDMGPKTLDHVAYWVVDRDPIVRFLEQHVGMHVIAREDNFTLMGSNARRGKLTLFDAEPPREAGALKHVALRVSDLAAARAELPEGTPELFDAGGGVMLTLVEAETDVEYDLDHVALWSSDPEATAAEYERYGFDRAGEARVEVGGAFIELHPTGRQVETNRPLLNHLAVLVDSADEVIADANDLGIEVESVVDAANTYAAFLWGPERVRIEYVEHKPTFSLT